MRERLYKFLDKHYPITGTEITVQFDKFPKKLINEVFGVSGAIFNDWAELRTDSTNYTFLYVYDEWKTWYYKDYNIAKTVYDGGYWVEHTYDKHGRALTTLTAEFVSTEYTYNDEDNMKIVKTTNQYGDITTRYYDEFGNCRVIKSSEGTVVI